MKTCVLDIEGNSLSEVHINKKGVAVPECSEIWCVATKVLGEPEPTIWEGQNLKKLAVYLGQFDVLVGHNIYGYDFPMLQRLLKVRHPRCIVDTLIVSRLIYPDRQEHPLGGNALANWGEYLKFPKSDYQGGWDSCSEALCNYCLQDVLLGERIYLTQLPFIKKTSSVVKFEHDVTRILQEQTENGFGYDLQAGTKLYQALMLEKLDVEDKMRVIFPDKVHHRVSAKTGKPLKDKIEVFNPSSRQQIASRLHDKYGWVAPETEKGNPQVDEEVLSKLKFDEAKVLVSSFETTKLISQIEDWNLRAEASRDGRIHGSINAQGAATGRCTHSQPNIAQVSSDARVRGLWCPALTGYVQVGADLKGLELRMLAHYMAKYDGGKYGEVLVSGDIHTHNQTAAGLGSRNQAKTFIYAYLYGASNVKLSKVLECSVGAADKVRRKFQKEIPALGKVQEVVKYQFLKSKSLELPDGRKIPCRKEHAALNTLLQGAGAIVSKYWMKIAHDDLSAMFPSKVFQMAYIHDELQYAVPKEIADEVGSILQEAAIKAGKVLKLNIQIDADYTVGSDWSHTH